MTNFYALFPEDLMLFNTRWANFYSLNSEMDDYRDATKCPKCGVYVTPYKWYPPYNLKISTTKKQKFGDFLWGAFFPFFISRKTQQLVQEYHFSGLEINPEPATLFLNKNKKIMLETEYFCTNISWGGANIDDNLSNAVYSGEKKCDFCRSDMQIKRIDKMIIENNSWNGEDFFTARGYSGLALTTERVKTLFEYEKLTNVIIVPLSKITFDINIPKLWDIRE